MQNDIDDIAEVALGWHREARGAALATVLQTWGSAPRPVGSLLAVSGAGEIAGSVSGGCVEGAVVVEALEALQDGQPRVLTYGVSDDDAIGLGLACGGTIRILVEPVGTAMDAAALAAIVAARRARQAVGYLVVPGQAGGRVLHPDDAGLQAGVRARFAADRSGFEGDEFLCLHSPPLRLAIIGAVHIAQSLVGMARRAGFDVLVIDPRSAFATSARFPGVALCEDWPDEALAAYGLDRRTAVVTLTHDPKLDDPAIIAALNSPAFYLGCLGSRRTHAKRVDRLRGAGLGAVQIARIHAPVGLDIGAVSPGEIAVSVLAEIVGVLRQHPPTR
jgi:xanthine dehydrogenase accessory factor